MADARRAATSPAEPTGPVRTCVGCRRRTNKSDLLRVVAVGSRPGRRSALVPDPRGRAPGRGAYVHPDLACLEAAQRRRSFQRALRLSEPPDMMTLRSYLETAVATRSLHEPITTSRRSTTQEDRL